MMIKNLMHLLQHMISVVVFFYSNTRQGMLMDYAVTEMFWFDDYFDAASPAKTMRGNCITTFLCTFPNVSPSINKNVTATLIFKAYLKSIYSRLGFKVVKYFETSPHFEKACKQFHHEKGKSKSFQKQTIGLQCYLNIPQHVTIIYDNRIDCNDNKDTFKILNEVSPSDD